jgi:hypothetical protein
VLFLKTEIVVDYDNLNRRVMRFCEVYGKVMLDFDVDQSRKTTRHKWINTQWWSRLDRRESSIKEQRDVSCEHIHQALNQIRSQITYGD